jgi:polyisoprenoid-binding protein YceI
MSLTTEITQLPTGTWTVDPARSRVGFQIKQLGFSTVHGSFGEFEGALELCRDLAASRAYGAVSVGSVDTRSRRRDKHLRSPSFFDAERFPRLTFESSAIRALGDETFEIAGYLTIHGVTRAITLTAELRHADDDQRVTIAVRGRLNRGEYGITYGRAVVSDVVELRLDLEATEQA